MARRRREIGVRVAIGAARNILVMVVRDGVALTAAGIAVGVPCAVAAAGMLASLMFGVTKSDPVTVVAGAAFFLVLGISAGLLPARRALTVQPVEALRAE